MENNRDILRQEYIEELEELEERMIRAELFAQKLPVFEDKIIRDKLSSDNCSLNFGHRYKNTPYSWGINRGRYISKSNRTISNIDKGVKYDKYLFSLYFNTISLYNSHEKHGLYELDTDIVYFFDRLNNTFYIEDKHIEEFLEKANEWYLNAVNQEKIIRRELEIEKAEERLRILKMEEM